VRLFVYLPLLVPALAALAARPLADRLEPRQATWLLTTAAVILAAAACPLLLPLARAVDYTVERWADEDAARALVRPGQRPSSPT